MGNVDLRGLQRIFNGRIDIVSSGNIYLNDLLSLQSNTNGHPLGSEFKATGVNLFADKLATAGDMIISVSNSIDFSSLHWILSMKIDGGGTLTLPEAGLRVERELYMTNIKVERLKLNFADTGYLIDNPTLITVTGSESLNLINNIVRMSNNPNFQSFEGKWIITNLYIDICESFIQQIPESRINIQQELYITGPNDMTNIKDFYSEPDRYVVVELKNLLLLGDAESSTIINFSMIRSLAIRNSPKLADLDFAEQSNPNAAIFLSGVELLTSIRMKFTNDGKCPFKDITIENFGTPRLITLEYSPSVHHSIRLDLVGVQLFCDNDRNLMKYCLPDKNNAIPAGDYCD